MTDRLYTVMPFTSAQAIEGLMSILFTDAASVLDMTYGKGQFWRWDVPSQVAIHTNDLNPERATDFHHDFTELPFPDGAYDVTVFDPPYHTDMGRGKASVMGNQFGTYPTIEHLRGAVALGAREAWRVARLGCIIKVQDYIHGQRAVWMSDWVKAALHPTEPYDFLMTIQARKLIDPKWNEQRSVWRNHATYWVFRKDGPVHSERRARTTSSGVRDGS